MAFAYRAVSGLLQRLDRGEQSGEGRADRLREPGRRHNARNRKPYRQDAQRADRPRHRKAEYGHVDIDRVKPFARQHQQGHAGYP